MGKLNPFFVLMLNLALLIIIVLFLFQSNAHGGEQITNFQAYAMGHQTKYSTAARYDPAAPASSYSNPSVHARLTQYIETAKEVYGPEYDPATHDIDGEEVMRAGGGKVRGRYMIGHGSLDSGEVPSLSQIRARSTGMSAPIRQRPNTTMNIVADLQVISILFAVH